MSSNVRNKTLSNMVWRFAERCGAQGVQLIISVVLARLLSPDDNGAVALTLVFISILQVFVESGLGTALIQKKDADDLDFSTVFYFNILMCIALYLLIFIFAPLIATKLYDNYDKSLIISVIRVLSLMVVISGVKNVQQAYISKTLQFRKFFFGTLGGTIGAAIVGITIAYKGFGIWALVGEYLIRELVNTIILWIMVKWRPKLMFSWKRLGGLFSFGWKMLFSSLLDVLYRNARQIIIGWKYKAEDLAYYNKGHQFPDLLTTNINNSIDSVLLPVMSEAQNNKERVKEMARRSMKISTYIMAPLMIGMIALAEPFVSLVLTDKWLACVPYMRIFCITSMFLPITTANLNAIKAMGRSDYFLKLEIVKKIIGVVVLLITMWYGVMVMAYSLLFTTVMSQIINSWPNRKLLNYSYLAQLKDILPGILLAVFMGLCVYPISFLGLSDILTMLLQIILGAVIYIGGSVLFKMESFNYVLGIVKPILDKIFKKSKGIN